MNVLVLGATGMLGNAVFRVLAQCGDHHVFGTARQPEDRKHFSAALAERLVISGSLERLDVLTMLFERIQPDVVVNCVALRKSVPMQLDTAIPILSVLPHRLAHLCLVRGARLVQISSDGVFSGARGNYTEADLPDAVDAYGTAKLLGEVDGAPAVTIRTSIIGHELRSHSGLLEWFLAQRDQCRCFTRAIFSGMPTVILAQIIRDAILPRPELVGVYHVASEPISKFDLLGMVAQRYGKKIEIVPDDSIAINRSLSAKRFAAATGFAPPAWPSMIDAMFSYHYGLARE